MFSPSLLFLHSASCFLYRCFQYDGKYFSCVFRASYLIFMIFFHFDLTFIQHERMSSFCILNAAFLASCFEVTDISPVYNSSAFVKKFLM